MNMSFHYFGVLILALTVGFEKKDAQKIAFFSQYVDDYVKPQTLKIPLEMRGYLMDNGLIPNKRISEITPLPTGIGVVDALTKSIEYNKKSIVPFHFIPERCLAEYGDLPEGHPDRVNYRCIQYPWKKEVADEKGMLLERLFYQHLFVEAKNELVNDRDGWLVNLGILLHVLADTFSHETFSGFHGWENYAYLLKAKAHGSDKDLLNRASGKIYYQVYAVGHANLGHIPDAAGIDYEFTRPYSPDDTEYTKKEICNNYERVYSAYKKVIEILRVASVIFYNKPARDWENYPDLLQQMMDIHKKSLVTGTFDMLGEYETFPELHKIWSRYIPAPNYEYDVNMMNFNKPDPDLLRFIVHTERHRTAVLTGKIQSICYKQTV